MKVALGNRHRAMWRYSSFFQTSPYARANVCITKKKQKRNSVTWSEKGKQNVHAKTGLSHLHCTFPWELQLPDTQVSQLNHPSQKPDLGVLVFRGFLTLSLLAPQSLGSCFSVKEKANHPKFCIHNKIKTLVCIPFKLFGVSVYLLCIILKIILCKKIY